MSTAPRSNMDRLLEATWHAEQRHFWYRGFRRFVRPLLREAVQGVAHPRLLDCGCGTGTNLGMLAEFGEAFGFDYTWTGLTFGQSAGRTRLAQATAAQVPFPAASFDVVTSFDVLGVLPDAIERAAFGELFRVLRPGGALIVNVAAMEVLRGDHAALSGEVRRYSRAQLGRTLTGAGFSTVRLTHTNASLFPLMLGVRLWQRARGATASASDMDVPAGPLNALLSACVIAESVVLPWVTFPFGSSILGLARKPPGAPAARDAPHT